MTDQFRAMCDELAEAYAWCIEEYMTAPAEEDTLIQRARALLAQPEPVAPTDEELMELMPQQMRDDLAAAARALTGDMPWPDNPKAAAAMRIILNRHAVDHARAVLARWGHPTPQPETNAFAIVQQRLEQLAGDQELMIYRWPLREDWGIEHTNPSSSVQLGEVSGEYGCTGRTLEEAVCKLAELLPTPEAT